MYQKASLSIDAIDRIERAYSNGSYVERLVITGTKK